MHRRRAVDPAPAVAVSDLRMRYGTKDVLHGVSFAVERGEVVTLLGPNGAGKTTIIEILEGFRMPSAGAVNVLGADPAHADEDWRARVGIVLQSWRDHGKWRVRQLLHNLGRFYEPYATNRSATAAAGRRADRDGRADRAGEPAHLDPSVRAATAARRRDRPHRST